MMKFLNIRQLKEIIRLLYVLQMNVSIHILMFKTTQDNTVVMVTTVLKYYSNNELNGLT